MALFIDKPVAAQTYTNSKSKVVKKIEQATSNDTQQKQDDKTTLNLNGIDYDTNTGVSTVASDGKS